MLNFVAYQYLTLPSLSFYLSIYLSIHHPQLTEVLLKFTNLISSLLYFKTVFIGSGGKKYFMSFQDLEPPLGISYQNCVQVTNVGRGVHVEDWTEKLRNKITEKCYQTQISKLSPFKICESICKEYFSGGGKLCMGSNPAIKYRDLNYKYVGSCKLQTHCN